MSTKSQRKRIKNVEKVAKTQKRFSSGCICFPEDEQPRFSYPVMQKIALGVSCPDHGDRLQPQPAIYTPAWKREKDSVALEFHSPQFQRAWNASFPSTQWPAEEIMIDGRLHLKLKDGTILSADGGLPDTSSGRHSSLEFVGNPLSNIYRWNPKTVAQRLALECPADILLMGGAAGSLKTSTLLIDLVLEYDNPRLNGYFFRLNIPDAEDSIALGRAMFSQMGATFKDSEKLFQLPSGGRIHFRYLNSDSDLYQNQGKEMSVIAIDESTQFPEDHIRYLLSRNRTTDPSLKPRMRLGTNPGNIGNTWHMKVFMGGVCPHCSPDRAPRQGVPFSGATWTDGVPIAPLTVAYVLSSVRDHDLLGSDYIERLKQQKHGIAKALLDGCWNVSEGHFFDIFHPNGPNVVPRADVGVQKWWPRWVSADYGFKGSLGAAHLFVHEPPSDEHENGRIYIYAELGIRVPADEFAEKILRDLVSLLRSTPNSWRPWYLSPDCFADHGGGFTLAKQMNNHLQKHGFPGFHRANHDREGGAGWLYSGLLSGDLVICAECKKTIEAFSTRMHDPKRDCDVLKRVGDDLDDYYDSARYGYYSPESANPEVPIPPEVSSEMRFASLYKQDPDMTLTTLALQHSQGLFQPEENTPTFYSRHMQMRHYRAQNRSRYRW